MSLSESNPSSRRQGSEVSSESPSRAGKSSVGASSQPRSSREPRSAESNPSSRRLGPGGFVAICGPWVAGVGQLAVSGAALEGVIPSARHTP